MNASLLITPEIHCMNVSLLVIAEIHCPSLSHLQYATVNTSSTTYGTEVNVTCVEGFELKNGLASLTVTCGVDTWLPDISDLSCTRKRDTFLHMSEQQSPNFERSSRQDLHAVIHLGPHISSMLASLLPLSSSKLLSVMHLENLMTPKRTAG